ncbi:MAG: Uridine kinase [Candidatus Methanogasteraceae archaeon]|nr:MAG: Uridine kinase [ANME-2 cluster archaeon]
MVSSSYSVDVNADVVRKIDDLLEHTGTDLQSRHRTFREDLKEIARGSRSDPVYLTLWMEEGNGKVVNEVLTLPRAIFDPGTERYSRLVEYMAVCLNIRGETLGIKQIGIEASTGTDTRASTGTGVVVGGINIDRLSIDVRRYFEKEFFITLLDANFGRPIRWRKGRLEQEGVRIGQVRSGRYDQGAALGLVVTGTDIKTVALESGNVVYRKEVAIGEEMPLEELLDYCLAEAALAVGIQEREMEDIYIGVPGPVDPWGNIVRVPAMKVVTKESLERLQQKYPNARFINDANVEAVYHRIIWAGDIAIATDQPTVGLVLRKGIGFAILVGGYLASWVGAPMETHFRVNFADDAPLCNCGMKGCLELPATWVVERFMQLVLENNISLPPEFAGKVSCVGGECGILARDVGAFMNYKGDLGRVATDVFIEYGENLSILFGELARLMDVSGFWVVLSGGMVQGAEEREAIIQGIARGIDSKFPGIRIEILSGIAEDGAGYGNGSGGDGNGNSAGNGGANGCVCGNSHRITRYERISGKWQGAVGAALCALQDKQMKMRIEPETKLTIGAAEEIVSSRIAEIFNTGKKLSTQTIIGVAGPSGGGKSYFAELLKSKIEEMAEKASNGVKAEVVTMDNYLIPKEKRKKGGIRAKYSLDRLWKDIIDISSGKAIHHPLFDQVSRVRYSKLGKFLDDKSTATGNRLSEKKTELFHRINQLTEWSGEATKRVNPDKYTIVLIDGILALDNPTTNKLYYDYRIFVNASWILRLCAAISRAQQENWYKGANTADIIEKFVFKRPEEEAIINVTYLDADMMVDNDFYENKVESDLKELLGDVYPRLDRELYAQYYIIYALMMDNDYRAETIFKERLESINELIRASRIEDMYEEGAGMRLEGDVCKMAEIAKLG